MARRAGQRRHQLRATRSGTDLRDTLAALVIAVIPARGMKHLALAGFYSRNIWDVGHVEQPGGPDHRVEFVLLAPPLAVLRYQLPDRTFIDHPPLSKFGVE